MTDALFDATPYMVVGDDPVDVSNLSEGRRLTLRQRADILKGIHPLNGELLHSEAPDDAAPGDRPRPFTCGTCAHRTRHGRWAKCSIGPQSRGAATDVRGWWPACHLYSDIPKNPDESEPT